MNRLLLGVWMAVPLLGQQWAKPELPYRLRVEVLEHASNLPIRANVDFDAILQRAGVKGTIDPASIHIFARSAEISAAVSDPIGDFGKGAISWYVPGAAQGIYYIYFDIREHGPKPFRDDQEPIGDGDSFHYNRPDGFDPLGIGMNCDQPVAIDWDGDGRVDILHRNIYSYAFGQPYWGIYFWRNVGTNQNPKFDRYVRLQADGKYLGDVYNSFRVVDYDGDGNPDILFGIGGGKLRGTMRLYRNTGRRDPRGLPILTAGPEVSRIGGGDLAYSMQLRSWDEDPAPSLFTLRSLVQYFPKPLVEYTWFRHPPLIGDRSTLRFGAGQPIALAGSTTYQAWPNDFYDWNGDGKPDLIGTTDDLHSNPPHPCLMVWENTGTRARPEFGRPPFCAEGFPRLPFSTPTAVDGPAFHGLFLQLMGGWLRYFEQDPSARGAKFRDRGLLLARGQACSSGGYNGVEVADWEGDGDLDFIVGNEFGYVQLIENVSRGGRTMFASPRTIPLADGTPMRVARWNFLNDGDPEWNLGQSKPAYVDWDGDGDLDLLVGNNANRIAYFENIGTRAKPRFAPLRRLTYDNGEHFSFRKHPAVADWNGDGLPDLVAGFSGVREKIDPDGTEAVCLFLRYRGADGRLHLHPGVPFRLADGSEFRLPVPYRHGFEVADWNGDGKLDVFTNEQGRLYVYLNEGSNERPLLRKQLLKAFGEPIQLSHHETSIKVIDWDRDGAPDLVLGGESGWLYYFRRAVLELDHPPQMRIGELESNRDR